MAQQATLLLITCTVAALLGGIQGFTCPTLFDFYPDPEDCAKFYRCFWGAGYPFDCPEGTLWNHKVLTCDFAYNVDCDDRYWGDQAHYVEEHTQDHTHDYMYDYGHKDNSRAESSDTDYGGGWDSAGNSRDDSSQWSDFNKWAENNGESEPMREGAGGSEPADTDGTVRDRHPEYKTNTGSPRDRDRQPEYKTNTGSPRDRDRQPEYKTNTVSPRDRGRHPEYDINTGSPRDRDRQPEYKTNTGSPRDRNRHTRLRPPNTTDRVHIHIKQNNRTKTETKQTTTTVTTEDKLLIDHLEKLKPGEEKPDRIGSKGSFLEQKTADRSRDANVDYVYANDKDDTGKSHGRYGYYGFPGIQRSGYYAPPSQRIPFFWPFEKRK